jgi:hypothetical protein
MPARIVRRYRPAHNIGHFRYLECDEIHESDRPTGDIAPWEDVVFAFDPKLKDRATPASVLPMSPSSAPVVEEMYDCDENGVIRVTIRNLTDGYERVYALRRNAG